MSVEEINERLADRFALLRSGDPTSPQRHRTLHAVIEWSWNLLDEPQQAVLRRLCRFPAGFTLDAATDIAEWGIVDDLPSALDGLVNQSLLTVVEHDEPIGLRYHMLETVREFGEEQLQAGESDQINRRMAAWASAFSRELLTGFQSREQVGTVHLVEAEHDNLLAVLRVATERGDAVTTYSVFAPLGFLWAVRGSHSEVFNWGPRVVAVDPRGPQESQIASDLLIAAYLLAGMHMILGGQIRPCLLYTSPSPRD